MLFHARGLLNTKAIQNNLDWVWPYWVERQFNPSDPSFIPRAFSFSHINLTHRNWTAVGVPDVPFYPIVDPRGLVTPLFDGWSLDFWFIPDTGPILWPSKLASVEQTLSMSDNLAVRTIATCESKPDVAIENVTTLSLIEGEPHCHVQVRFHGTERGAIAVALRPYNPEGVSIVEEIAVLDNRRGWLVNDSNTIIFDREPSRYLLSNYAMGDVSLRLNEKQTENNVSCPVSMATAVALFPVHENDHSTCEISIPIYNELDTKKRPKFERTLGWTDAIAPLARLHITDNHVQRLYDLALANLVLHAPGEVYPGPYTYKRFWFRDAVFILNALLSLGGVERTRRAMGEFAPRQRLDGYFLSQEGEWDSNGEALWMYHRFASLTGETLPPEWLHAIAKGARWISRKRLPLQPPNNLRPGYCRQDSARSTWARMIFIIGMISGGCRIAGGILRIARYRPQTAESCAREAMEFLDTIQKSFPTGSQQRFPGAIPASPHRRMDSGAIGSIVADYPLQLFVPGFEHVIKTVDYLCEHCMHGGGFFQNMIHSGINAYLTLHLAQVRLRAGDAKAAWSLMDGVAALASPTGQWPEAIHPMTLGGCMGDGQHIWAAAEWLMLLRNFFVLGRR